MVVLITCYNTHRSVILYKDVFGITDIVGHMRRLLFIIDSTRLLYGQLHYCGFLKRSPNYGLVGTTSDCRIYYLPENGELAGYVLSRTRTVQVDPDLFYSFMLSHCCNYENSYLKLRDWFFHQYNKFHHSSFFLVLLVYLKIKWQLGFLKNRHF